MNWIIVSWVFVALLTAANIFFFLKLKKASEQMLKMAFPKAKNMTDALQQMQGMMGQMGAMGGKKGGRPMPGQGDPRLKAAIDMLQQLQQKGGKR